MHARDELVPLVYAELRRQAAVHLRRERPDHTLQPTALVHEAYVRLIDQRRVAWQNRAHFFGIAAQMMRRVLVDHARARQAGKRPHGGWRVAVNEEHAMTPPVDLDLILLDQALTELAALDPRQAHMVELRYFGGLSEHDVAEELSLSRSTVTRECQSARAWLHRRMSGRLARRSMMDAARWAQVKALFHAALDLPPAERPAFVKAESKADEELAAEVESLLVAHGQAGGVPGCRVPWRAVGGEPTDAGSLEPGDWPV